MDHPEDPQVVNHPEGTGRGAPEGPPGAGIPEGTWRWIMYLMGNIQALEREVRIKKTETNESAPVTTKAQKERDIANKEAKQPSGVVTKLRRKLDRPEGLGIAVSDRRPLESGSSDEGWGPRPGAGRPEAPGGGTSEQLHALRSWQQAGA